jgi:hypothetical protein
MKTSLRRKPLTFGHFIASVYEIYGKRKARGIVQHAVNARLLQFRGLGRIWIS